MKRWWIVVLLWLALTYPASIGPVGYARGYFGYSYNPPDIYIPILPPNKAILLTGGDWRHSLGRYYEHWFWIGMKHTPYPILP